VASVGAAAALGQLAESQAPGVWRGVQSGNYAAAYAFDRVQSRGSVVSSSTNSATVAIDTLKTVDQQYGCRTWSGTYELSYTGGSWQITAPHLSPQSCS